MPLFSLESQTRGRQRTPGDFAASFSYLDSSDLRFFDRWVNKLEESNTSTKTVFYSEVQALKDVKAESWGTAAKMRATDRHLLG